MKKSLLLTAAILAAAIVLADIPNYKTYTATGTTAASGIVPADPNLATRIVGFNVTSDKAGSVLSLKAGAGAYVVSSPTTNSATLTLAQTNGLAPNDFVIIARADGSTNRYCQISTFSAATNVTLTAVSGITTVIGDSVYKMGTASTIPIGSNTVNGSGEAIFTADRGRPIYFTADGTSAVTVNTLTVRQE